MNLNDITQLTTIDCVFCYCKIARKSPVLINHYLSTKLPSKVKNLPGFFYSWSKWFFNQNILSCQQGLSGIINMRIAWSINNYKLYFRIIKNFLKRIVTFYIRIISLYFICIQTIKASL